MTLADVHLPVYDVVMRHQTRVAVSAADVWTALHRADLGRSWVTRALLTLRGLRRPRATRRLTLDALAKAGFMPLGERPGREVAFGLVDAASRRRFRLYWLLVRPFSGVIRKAMLSAVAREAGRAQV